MLTKMRELKTLIGKLTREHSLTREEWLHILSHPEAGEALAQLALQTRRQVYGEDVYIRGLIEVTNHCKNDCYYCGIRRSNACVRRYRLTEAEILQRCALGYGLGLRSFVLQGGEDPLLSPDAVAGLVRRIKDQCPGSAVTLSLGEYSREIYQLWFEAGADRYLLRHETANPQHYQILHPPRQTLENRLRCLQDLKDIGYQVGCGFMVGSPGQTLEHLAEDLMLLQTFQPHMVGIGPFIPQKNTPFAGTPAGSLAQCLFLLSLVRLLLPAVLLPATTALGSIHPQGRELGLLSGANVCMPNLSPPQVRGDYALYDNKLSEGAEAAESLDLLRQRLDSIGCRLCLQRGDPIERN